MTDKSKTCTFSKRGRCALSIPFSLCEKCLAYHPKETDMEAMRERLHLND